jgi:hypothetical protein
MPHTPPPRRRKPIMVWDSWVVETPDIGRILSDGVRIVFDGDPDYDAELMHCAAFEMPIMYATRADLRRHWRTRAKGRPVRRTKRGRFTHPSPHIERVERIEQEEGQ